MAISKAVFFPIWVRNTADFVAALAERAQLALEIQLSADAPLRDCRANLANRVMFGRMQRSIHRSTYRSISPNIAAFRLLKQTKKSFGLLAPRCLSILSAYDCGLARCHGGKLPRERAIRCPGTAFPLGLPERVIPI